MLKKLKQVVSLRSLAMVVVVCFAVEAATMFMMKNLHQSEPLFTALLNAFVSAGAVAICLGLFVIPELLASHKRAQDQAHILETMLQAIPAPVFYKDEKGFYAGCNQRFADFLGQPKENIIGRTVHDISPTPLAQVYHKADMDLMKSGGTQVYETLVSHADDTEHDVMFHKAVFQKADGSPAGIIGVILDITERKQMERQLHMLASIDDLTKIPNRRELDSQLKHALLRAERSGEKIALMFIDMDGFKDVNDLYGHEAGDEVLKTIAQRITSLLRKSDVAGRMGGDEFAVMLENNISQDTTRVVAEKLLKTLAEPYRITGGEEAYISASIGIAFAPDDGSDIKTLLAAADDAMYEAKNLGKDTYSFAHLNDDKT